jgi:hypothetical protein
MAVAIHLMEKIGTVANAGRVHGTMAEQVHGITVGHLHGEITGREIPQIVALHQWILTGKEGSHQKVDSLQAGEDEAGSIVLTDIHFMETVEFFWQSHFYIFKILVI